MYSLYNLITLVSDLRTVYQACRKEENLKKIQEITVDECEDWIQKYVLNSDVEHRAMKEIAKTGEKFENKAKQEYNFWSFQYELLYRIFDEYTRSKAWADTGELKDFKDTTDLMMELTMKNLPNIVMNSHEDLFRTSFHRDFGDIFHGLKVFCHENSKRAATGNITSEQWKDLAAVFYNRSQQCFQTKKVLIYPNGWSDHGVFNLVSLAHLYYSDGNSDLLLSETIVQLRPLLENITKNLTELAYLPHITINTKLNISKILWLRDQEVFRKIIEFEKMHFISIHCATLGYYIQGRYGVETGDKDLREEALCGLKLLQNGYSRRSFKLTNSVLIEIILSLILVTEPKQDNHAYD